MAEWHLRSHRSPTGRLMHRLRKKRRMDRGMEFLQTKTAPRKARPTRARGGMVKLKLLSDNVVNIADPQTKKVIKSTVISVQENAANPLYVRRNILTKGAVIRTGAGAARITSRPGQDGVINAVLVKPKK